MKEILSLVLLCLSLALMAACSNESDTLPVESQERVESARELRLNNGRKWQADAAASKRVGEMQDLMREFDQSNLRQSPEEYQDLAQELHSSMSLLLQECRMQGRGHEELHKFLLPVMEELEVLGGKDEGAAESAKAHIQQQLAKYSTYFE